VYGGRAGSKDKVEIKHPPAILIGTPGRVADHIRRENISTASIKCLVLDEFDKSLEIGFEAELRQILAQLVNLEQKILTSATQKSSIPEFVGVKEPHYINFLGKRSPKLQLKMVEDASSSKLVILEKLLGELGTGNGIVFCNLKDTLHMVSEYLLLKKIGHTVFYGGMEQLDRERSLIKFRNGTERLLLATDLASRGIDVPELDFIIHFELPPKKVEFTHRNGRTARMHSEGTAYLIKEKNEVLPKFAASAEKFVLAGIKTVANSQWETLYINGGRKDKISKGDIAGLFFKQGKLRGEELGNIELKNDCAFVAVPSKKIKQLLKDLDNSRLKRKKVRITLVDAGNSK
jgi:superfamily II DNA/RNA helicase